MCYLSDAVRGQRSELQPVPLCGSVFCDSDKIPKTVSVAEEKVWLACDFSPWPTGSLALLLSSTALDGRRRPEHLKIVGS